MPARIGIHDLETLIGQLETRGPSPDEAMLSEICENLAFILGVRSDEVALLEITANRSSLEFILPPKLRQGGLVPIKVEGGMSLSARTVLERKPCIANDFASMPHARAFEGVPLGPRGAAPIQKIMSVPVVLGDRLIGVIQVSRKGASASAAGLDFTVQDLAQAQQLNGLLARIIKARTPVPPKSGSAESGPKQTASYKTRRTSRVTIVMPVEVILQSPKNEIVVEETNTLTVSAFGGCLALKAAPQIGQTVVVIHKESREETLCSVRSIRPVPKTASYEVGVEFAQPNPFFWRINFPPEDWDPAAFKRSSTPRGKA